MNELNLDLMNQQLEVALKAYEFHYQSKILFDKYPEFKLEQNIPNKRYSAKAIVPFKVSDSSGNLVVLALNSNDATGARSDQYNETNLIIPPSLKLLNGQEKNFPRSKKGIICEGCFPMFSLDKNGSTHFFVNSLEEITTQYISPNIPRPAIQSEYIIGLSSKEFEEILKSNKSIRPQIYFTTGLDENNQRFGDPHAIKNNIQTPGVIQVTGFYSITQNTDPMLEYIKDWKMPTRQSFK
ncbi:MAG: hypothetical protein WC758_01055 [Candidatus Woesearchaeota archaeon]|jgi:hypothetical protein